jgi:hypothetical protein
VDVSILRGADGRRFIVSGPFDHEMPYFYIVIADITFWLKNEPEIYAWMDDNLPRGRMHQEGMTIALEQETDVTAFIMRWS